MNMQKQKEIGRGTVYLVGEWKRRMKRGRRGEKEGEGGSGWQGGSQKGWERGGKGEREAKKAQRVGELTPSTGEREKKGKARDGS